ncbi:hypothetical protein [Amycolatopsis sp. WGS_07]|uniref:hypothetical protein n=1 Tax=Amycolatopsis sp. WGS_07 TaxID=3076764 RepID=UPI003872DE1F
MRLASARGRSWDPVPFAVLWAGQFASVLGTLMTNFGIVLWAWQRTGQTTPVAMVEFCSFGAVVVFGPLAGALCDRWGRLRTLVASNAAAALLLAGLATASALGSLSTATVYATLVALGIVLAFQYPALLASVSFWCLNATTRARAVCCRWRCPSRASWGPRQPPSCFPTAG